MRRFGLRIDLQGLGVGEVVRALPVEDLLPVGEARVMGPRSPRSSNLHMFEGALRPRFGYEAFADRVSSRKVTGLALAQFSNESVDFIRADRTTIYRLASGVWSSLLTGLTGTDADMLATAMVARAGASISNELFLCNGVDAVYGYTGGASTPTAVSAATFTGARVLLGHRGRSLCMNTFESSTRKYQRIRYSIVGDPRDHTGTGAGFVDLTDDPYPIAGALVIGGRIAVFKGNSIGGGITVGTLTGSTNSPYRWDSINSSGIGLYVPRTMIPIATDLAFFVGHDGFYIYDGVRALQPIAETISRDVVSRINPNALYAGFAWYKPKTGEIFVHLPMGTSTFASEVWVLNIRDKRVYGPLSFTASLTAMAIRADTGALQWDQLTGTWDALSSTYPSWDSMRGAASESVTVFGDIDGYTWQHDETQVTDAGTFIPCEYDTAAIRAEGQTVIDAQGNQRVLAADDVLTLQDVTLFNVNRGEWIPAISVSVDGGRTFTSINADGDTATLGDDTSRGRVQAKHYTCSIPGTWFQIRVGGFAPMTPHALRLEFSYAGSDRNS